MDRWRRKLTGKGRDRHKDKQQQVVLAGPTEEPSLLSRNDPESADYNVEPHFPPIRLEVDNSNGSTSEYETEVERRRSSAQSTPSIFGNLSISNTFRERSNSRTRHNNPLGLSVIWEPERERSLDIVLVHGLGGTSQSTWSKDHDPRFFWPHLWLPNEPEIGSARILSFGYDADWRSTGSKTALNITDFAKELLFAMKFTKNEDRDLEDLGLGDVPIIFIVHSMGGLVVKKAYILGQADEEYKDIVKSVSAIIFLSTPHRGSNLAELLNRILSTSVLRYSPKQYVSDLQKNSPALEDLNEQFRKVAPKLHIVSFYETLQTVVGPKKVMVLEKESAILGYPGEISRAMNADHHNVCKYQSPRDTNYVSIRDILKTLVDRLRAMGGGLRRASSSEDSQPVELLLSIIDRPDDDYNFFRDRWMPGTCEWILQESTVQTWLESSSSSSILWLHALPASGKSILSSFIINHIKEQGLLCQFYFFRFGEQSKRSINGLLRSLAYQISQDIPQFRKQLRDLAEDGLRLEKTDSRTIWNRLFVSSLLHLNLRTPLYWVLDALDEAESPQLLLDLLAGLNRSQVPIKILIVSRETQTLSMGLSQLCDFVPLENISITNQSQEDLRLYVGSRMHVLKWDSEFKAEISKKILLRADGNFLWVHLAIQEILRRHTDDDIRQALEDMPTGMEAMYSRMASAIANNTGPTDKELARRIFTWTMYARRSLTLRELSEALKPHFNRIPDLRSTISEVCGHFVVVDVSDQVTMIHQTARDYLTKAQGMELFIDDEQVHQELFQQCMTYLMSGSIRGRLNQHGTELKRDFIQYASTSWNYHLSRMPKIPTLTLTTISQFLRGQHVLSWIQILASLHQLKVLVYTSRSLSDLANNKRFSRVDIDLDPSLKDLFRSWSIDLIKLVGKFGSTLVQDPTSAQRFIPDLCPQNSMLFRQFTKQKSLRAISVSGITTTDWDDSVAHISLRKYQTSRLICSRRYLAVVATNREKKGVTILWNSATFEKVATLVHGEYITASCFNPPGTRYVSCGVLSTNVWEVPSGRLIETIESPQDTAILGVVCAEAGNNIMIASDDKAIRQLSTQSSTLQWSYIQSLRESDASDFGYANSPCCMAFNPDGTQIAVAYRGFPLSVWSVVDHQLISRCLRNAEGHGFNDTVWTSVDTVCWNPRFGSLLGRYHDGCVFKWDPYDQVNQELRTAASIVQCSPDGASFATCDNYGVIRLFNYQTFGSLYQLRCDATPKAFAFSPDSRRFYDIRDTVCTAWEPPALGELQDTDELVEDLWDTQSNISFSTDNAQMAELQDPITALAVSNSGRYFCAGNEIGEIGLYDRDSKKIMDVWRSPRLMMTDYLVFDNDGRRIAIAELGGDITIKSLNPPVANSATKAWEIRSVFELRISPEMSAVRQILFDRAGTCLLLAGHALAQVWSLEGRSMLAQREEQIAPGTRWLNDPNEADLLLAFDQQGVRKFTWKALEPGLKIPYRLPSEKATQEKRRGTPTKSARSSIVPGADAYPDVEAKLTQDRCHVLVRMTCTPGIHTAHTIILSVSGLSAFPGPPSTPSSILDDNGIASLSAATVQLPKEISTSIEIPLGVLSRNRLVFLDQDFWVCTWKLDSHPAKEESSLSRSRATESSDALKKHFTIPRDWITEDTMSLIHLAEDGTIFCPKGGEVAVVGTRLGSGR